MFRILAGIHANSLHEDPSTAVIQRGASTKRLTIVCRLSLPYLQIPTALPIQIYRILPRSNRLLVIRVKIAVTRGPEFSEEMVTMILPLITQAAGR